MSSVYSGYVSESSSTATQSTTTANNTSTSESTSGMDDGGKSSSIRTDDISMEDLSMLSTDSGDLFSGIFHSAGLYKSNEIDYFKYRYRFGAINPAKSLTTAKEYLFFTKPDLNIYPRDNTSGSISGDYNSSLAVRPFWYEMYNDYPEVLQCLQESLSADPFNHLLGNMVQSELDVPSFSSEMVETPENMYGVNYSYHGSAEASDDGFDFSLEFKDTKDLLVYRYFKAYEDYEKLKHHGQLEPYRQYIVDKVLYDQYSIYKFIVGDDGETIVYYCKYYGVKSKSLPREAFSNTNFDNGISYTVDFNAAFFDDTNTSILYAFNSIAQSYANGRKYDLDIHNTILDRPDNRPANGAYIDIDTTSAAAKASFAGKLYKLKWRGDDQI